MLHFPLAEANAAHYAAIMGSCSGSSLPQLLLAQSPMSTQSEDNTLAKEFQAMETQRLLQSDNSEPSAPTQLLIEEPPSERYAMEPLQRSSPHETEHASGINNNNENSDNTGEIVHNNNNDVTNEATDDANLTNSNSNLLNGNESEYDNVNASVI